MSARFLSEMRESVKKTGSNQEVVLVVPRPSEHVLLHTKSFYPPGVYRMPTGRLLPDEQPDQAFFREFREELGQVGRIESKLGVLLHKLMWQDDYLEFTSHIYLAAETIGVVHPQSADEQITGFMDVPLSDLPSVAEKLQNLPGDWLDWGRFRAVAHYVVIEWI